MPVILENPIIDSYVKGLQMRRQQEQTEFDRTQKKEESGRAEQQLKGYLAHLTAEEAHQKAQIDLEKQRVGTERAMHELAARKQIGEMINSGGYRPGQGPSPTNPQTTMGIQQNQAPGANKDIGFVGPNEFAGMDPNFKQTILNGLPTTQQSVVPQGITAQPGTPSAPIQIGDMQINPDDFAGPAQMLQSHLNSLRATGAVNAQNKGLEAGAVATAEQPTKLEQIGATGQNQLNLANVNTEAKKAELLQSAADAKTLQTQKDAAALARTNATVSGRIASARIGATARIEAAKIGQTVDPQMVTNNAILHATGQGGAALGNSKQDVATKQTMSNLGYVDMSPKTAEQLKGAHSLDPLYEKMKGFIQNLPEDTPSAILQGLAARIPATDLNNFKKEVLAVSGNVSKTIGGESGRLTDKDILRAMGIMTTPGITKKQALDRIAFFEATTRSKVMDTILGGQGDHQKLQNLETYGFNPAQFNGPVDYKGKQVPRFKQDQDGEWLVFNAKRGGYEGVDARR